ncbi:MAG: energy-coupling factor ABC transporter ATP-binding protein [Sphingomonadaceae bacterium]
MSLIEFENVSFRYSGTTRMILNEVSLSIEEGEFVAVFGQGKSTLLMCLCGAIPHLLPGKFSGAVRVDGMDTQQHKIADISRKVGVVLQDPENQLFNLTVEGDVVFGMENLLVPPHEMEARLQDALRTVRMSDFRRRMSHELSGGQKQRAAIASVLAMQPKILVMDEPTRELDPLGTEEVFEVLGRLKKQGKTIVIVENDPEHLAPLADKMILLRDGNLELMTEPREFYRRVKGDEKIRFPQVTELYFQLENRLDLGPKVPLTLEEGVEVFSRV